MADNDPATSQKPLTKTEFITRMVDATGLAKPQVTGFLDDLASLIASNLADGGPGQVTIPGLMKIKVVRKPATPEHEGRNPFTGEMGIIKAKPARNSVKILPLKGLKDMV